MDGFWKFLGLAVMAAVIALTLRTANKPFGTVFSLAAGAMLLLALIDPMKQAAETLSEIARAAENDQEHVTLILKMLGVSFAAELGAQACRDAGEESIAMRIEMSAKIMLVVLAAPMLRQMAQLILELTA
ncbi:MAG: hypothetical protein IJ214_03095 [Clostridia bacterium]|nr:hypothetical protein [Clostridia bacterium]